MSMYTPGTPPRGNTTQPVRYPPQKPTNSPGPMNLRSSVDDLQPPGNSTVMDGRYPQQNLYSNSSVNPTQMGHYGMQGPVNVNQQGGIKMTDLNALSSLLTNNRPNGIPMQPQQSGPQGPQTANVLGRVGGTGNVSQIPIGIGRGTANIPVNGNMRMSNPNQMPQSVPNSNVPMGPNGSQPRPPMGRSMPQSQNVAPNTNQPQQPRIPINQSINNPSGMRTGMQQPPSTYNPSSYPQGNTMNANYTQAAISNLIDRTLQQNPNVPPQSMVQGPGSPQKQENLLSQLNEPSYDMAFPQLNVNSRNGVVNMSKGDMEFSLGAEDFPALPGFKGGSNEPSGIPYSKTAQNMMGSSQGITGVNVGNYVQQDVNRLGTPPGPSNISQYEQFLQRQPQQKVIVPDRFGLLGLLSVIRMTDPDLNTLALGTDLTTLGLNLNSPDCLYNTFASPWSDGPSSTKREPEYYIPMCYYIPGPIQSPFAKMSLFSEETLFYIFYSMPRDVLQAASAAELYKREWRFHKEHKVWITRAPGTEPQKTASYERGSYVYFDVATWEKVRKDNFVLSYDQLESSPPHVDTVNKTN